MVGFRLRSGLPREHAEHICNRLQSDHELQHLRETSGAPTRTEEAAAERYEELSKKKINNKKIVNR